jgi:hypothetical protein
MNDLSRIGAGSEEAARHNADEAFAWRSRRIADLVSDNEVSVRLRNCIALAIAAGTLPFETVGEYLDAGSSAQAAMLRGVWSFGRKTAHELDELVHAEAAGKPVPLVSAIPPPAPDREKPPERTALVERFADVQASAIYEGEIVSTRLLNVMRYSALAQMKVLEVLDDYRRVTAGLLRQDNCGRKCLDEFRALCQRYVARRMMDDGVSGPKIREALSAIFGEVVIPDFALSDVVEVETPLGVPEHQCLQERLEWMLAELDDRYADVVRRRYGIGQVAPATLEEIGLRYRLTRERIRQIESRALKRLRIRSRRAPLGGLIAAEAERQWARLSGGEQVLRARDLSDRRHGLDPYFVLALDISETRRARWLEDVAASLPHGWLARSWDVASVEALGAELRRLLATTPLPAPIADLPITGDSSHIAAAYELILGRQVRNGYLMPPRIGVRVLRAMGLHMVLGQLSRPVALGAVLPSYHRHFPTDPCSARDAEIVMEAAPHLFLEIEEGSWLALGSAGRLPPGAEEVSPLRVRAPEEPGTISHALQSALADRGPTRLGDLLQSSHAILPPGRSVNSVGPVLLMRPDLFIRVLPGVYAVGEHVRGNGLPGSEAMPILLSDGQARLYALARYAGEPVDLFPFWSYAAEYHLCRWARHSGGPGIFCSLLAIADTARWPISNSEKHEWALLQRRYARFELGSQLRRHAAYVRPDLDRILAACVYGGQTGWLNWMSANRLTGRKLDSHGGAGIVALLVRLGALSEPLENGFRWQMPHCVTGVAAQLREELRLELARTGKLTWDSDPGRRWARQAQAAETALDSWVDAGCVAAMFAAGGIAEAEYDEEDPVEALLAEHRRARQAERREATLQWLLEE